MSVTCIFSATGGLSARGVHMCRARRWHEARALRWRRQTARWRRPRGGVGHAREMERGTAGDAVQCGMGKLRGAGWGRERMEVGPCGAGGREQAWAGASGRRGDFCRL
jgi:hypothetical protein